MKTMCSRWPFIEFQCSHFVKRNEICSSVKPNRNEWSIEHSKQKQHGKIVKFIQSINYRAKRSAPVISHRCIDTIQSAVSSDGEAEEIKNTETMNAVELLKSAVQLACHPAVLMQYDSIVSVHALRVYRVLNVVLELFSIHRMSTQPDLVMKSLLRKNLRQSMGCNAKSRNIWWAASEVSVCFGCWARRYCGEISQNNLLIYRYGIYFRQRIVSLHRLWVMKYIRD